MIKLIEHTYHREVINSLRYERGVISTTPHPQRRPICPSTTEIEAVEQKEKYKSEQNGDGEDESLIEFQLRRSRGATIGSSVSGTIVGYFLVRNAVFNTKRHVIYRILLAIPRTHPKQIAFPMLKEIKNESPVDKIGI